MPTLEAGSVDAIVSDPPWKDYVTSTYDASEWHEPIVRVAPSRYAGELFRLLRDDAACVLWCDWESFQEHADALADAGFQVKNCIVWAKPNHTAGDLDGNLGYRHEQAVFAVKGRWQRHGLRDVNLWNEPHLFSRGFRYHPTEKPVGLIRRAVRLAAPPGSLVFDPFAGSGTTGVAAIAEGRGFCGIERVESYIPIIKKRIAETVRQESLFSEGAA
jgi:DNA modification methylase